MARRKKRSLVERLKEGSQDFAIDTMWFFAYMLVIYGAEKLAGALFGDELMFGHFKKVYIFEAADVLNLFAFVAGSCKRLYQSE
jgi:hypothetical protein